MAKKRVGKSENSEPTELILSKEEFKSQIEEQIEIGEKILNFEVKNQKDLDKNQEDYSFWDDYNSEFLKQSFNNQYNVYKKSYTNVGILSEIQFFNSGKPTQVELLKEKIGSKVKHLRKLSAKIELLKCSIESEKSKDVPTIKEVKTNNIFIVHGHDAKTKIEVARTIERLGLVPIILHEQANEGRTIIEKFETHSKVGFAIILMTSDDVGRVKTSDVDLSRARQNVILEMGYFIGKLGRGNVFPLHEEGVELPGDLSGLLYTPIDNSGYWKLALVKELKAAGYEVDANKII